MPPSWPVEIRREGYFVFHGIGLQEGQVSLRDGLIEVGHTWSVARRLNRGQFRFPARETRIGVESGAFGRQWLVISGPSGGRPAFVSIRPLSRAALEEIWHALVAAGASRAS